MGVLRRVAVPVVLATGIALGIAAVDDSAPTGVAPPAAAPGDLAPLADGPISGRTTPEQLAQLTALWTGWAQDLTGSTDAALPAELSSLTFEEATYVLLSARAVQVSAAAADSEGDVEQAARDEGLAASPPGVTLGRPAGSPSGCVALSYADEPLGRTYFGLWPGEDAPGPEPLSELEAVLLRAARVGLATSDAATCGLGGVAYSPAAQQAIRVLSPERLGD